MQSLDDLTINIIDRLGNSIADYTLHGEIIC
jgi:hypothetical protein